MKRLYFQIGHRDLIGGGQLALYHLALALQQKFDVTLSSDFHPGMAEYEYLRPAEFKVGICEDPDVFLASSYTENIPPRGRTNVFYTFFPRHTTPSTFQYDDIVTISDFSARHVKDRWRVAPLVVVGGAFSPDYQPAPVKENLILSCSRFFMEGNPQTLQGHSKNQHLIIEAFKALPETLRRDWRLVLAGSVLTEQDGQYLRACKELAKGLPNVEFYPMIGKGPCRELYAKAKIFVHAMGYGRPDIAETEHFGFCVEKALLSGAYCLTYKEGGAAELAHETFGTLPELRAYLQRAVAMEHDGEHIAAANRWRTWEHFQDRVNWVFGKWA